MCDEFKPECAPECAPECGPELNAFFNTMDYNIHRSYQTETIDNTMDTTIHRSHQTEKDKDKIDSLITNILDIMYSNTFNKLNDDFFTCMNLINCIETMNKTNANYDDYEKFYMRLKTSMETEQPVVLD